MHNRLEPVHPLSNIRLEARTLLSKFFLVMKQPCEPFAESLNRETIVVALQEDIWKALNASKAREQVKACFQEVWLAVQDKFLYVDKVPNVDWLDKAFDKLVVNTFKNHNALNVKERELILQIINYYRAIIKQCYVLHQLANLGGDLYALDNNNDNVLQSDYNDHFFQVNKLAHAKEDLEKGLKILNAEFDPLNSQIDRYFECLKRNIEYYSNKELHHFSNLKAPFLDLQKAVAAFQERLHQFKLLLSDKKNLVSLPPEIKISIKKLQNELNLMAKVNILNFSGTLRNPDNFPKQITELGDALRLFKNGYSEKEQDLNAQAQNLLNEYTNIKSQLKAFKDNETDRLAKLRAYQLALKNQAVTQVLASVPRAELDVTEQLEGVQKSRDQLSAAVGFLKKIKLILGQQQLNIEAFSRSLRPDGKEKLSHLLHDISYDRILEKNNKVLDEAGKALIKKKSSAWASVELLTKSVNDFSPVIASLQKAAQDPERTEFEITELEKNLALRASELLLKQNEIIKRIDLYEEILQHHDEVILSLKASVSSQLDDLYNRAIKKVTDIQLEMNASCEQLASDIKKFKFEEVLPKVNIKLEYPEEARQLEKQLLQLKEIYAGHLKKLSAAEKGVKKSEDNAVATSAPKSNFFSRHWKKILAATTLGATLGAGAGFTIGLLSAAPTFGFGTIAFTALGFGIGAVVGGVTGLVGATIYECMQNKKNLKSPHIQELEAPAPRVIAAPTLSLQSRLSPHADLWLPANNKMDNFRPLKAAAMRNK